MDALLFALSFEVVLLQMRILQVQKLETRESSQVLKTGRRSVRRSSGWTDDLVSGETAEIHWMGDAQDRSLWIVATLGRVLLPAVLEGSVELRLADWRPTNKIEQLQQDKLAKDRDFVNDVIRRTLIEVAETGKWQSVKNAVELLKQSECDVESLRLKNEHLRASRQSLVAELDANRNQWAMELNNADQKVAVLRDKMSDDLHNANARLCYAEKWLFARFESLELKLDVPRAPPPRSDHEQRVHDELLKAFELQIKELEKTLEYWRQRYDTDIAEISARSQRKLEQLLSASSRRQELQKLYNLHEGEMRGWLTFKRERAARLAREEKLRLSAMRIQAWWRGVMVRRALGQFKFLRHTKGKGKKK